MRFLKNILIVFTVLIITLTITYSARVSVINILAKEQLSLFQIKITCLDISFASNINIIVDKLCLTSSKADIEIVDMTIQWQYSSKIRITDIDVRLANIKGTAHLFSNTNPAPQINNQQSRNNQNFSQLLSTALRAITEQISQFKMPMKINIAEISYLPFTIINQPTTKTTTALVQREMPYTAKLSALGNTLTFSLLNAL